MRLSKTSTIFFSLIVLCFAIGFSMGAFPERWRELRGEKRGPLTVLIASPELIPVSFFRDYEKATGNRVEIEVINSFHLYKTEAQKADLLFAPLAWLGDLTEILQPLPADQELHQLLSTDFLSLKLKLEYFLPVLWKTEESAGRQHLLIWGFATARDSRPETEELLFFLLTNSVRLREWAQVTPYAFTLQDSNTLKKFPDSQRAKLIREVSLPHLQIDQSYLNPNPMPTAPTITAPPPPAPEALPKTSKKRIQSPVKTEDGEDSQSEDSEKPPSVPQKIEEDRGD